MTKANQNSGNGTKLILFQGIYSNLVPYLFLQKNIKVFQ